MRAKVFAPQCPTRYDPMLDTRVPIVDLLPAKRFGDVVVLLPNNVTGMMMSPIVTCLKERLSEFDNRDFLIAIGDPSIIAAAAGIILKRLGTMKMLKWDKRLKDYNVVEITV